VAAADEKTVQNKKDAVRMAQIRSGHCHAFRALSPSDALFHRSTVPSTVVKKLATGLFSSNRSPD